MAERMFRVPLLSLAAMCVLLSCTRGPQVPTSVADVEPVQEDGVLYAAVGAANVDAEGSWDVDTFLVTTGLGFIKEDAADSSTVTLRACDGDWSLNISPPYHGTSKLSGIYRLSPAGDRLLIFYDTSGYYKAGAIVSLVEIQIKSRQMFAYVEGTLTKYQGMEFSAIGTARRTSRC